MRAALCIGLLVTLAAPAQSVRAECQEDLLRAKAVQDIEYLRRAYARATDAIGKNTDADVAAGRETYHRIFTPDAKLGASGIDGAMVGPDAWVKVVKDALGPMGPTQHLIGTQIVEIESIAFDRQCRVESGRARMNSYLQAWHTQADGKIWTFLGNYRDQVVYVAGAGWQISDMMLEEITSEVR